jgi:alkanesulfonate monooxygenase SsuD/methylene tetrahydromethanopterin reductase-like flavin-dependent oxidoreductase (luciferase family)
MNSEGERNMSKKVKLGISAPVPGASVQELIDFSIKAEEGGFDTVWFPDHVVFMAKKLTPEVWSVITAASTHTKSIHLGNVGDAHRIHPAIYAHRLATINHISQGRSFLCLGYGEKMNLDPYGIKWNKPLTRVVESVKIMRALWSGGSVNFEGEFYTLKDAELQIQPDFNNGVPIYIAATGPKALRVAGEYGDGWLTNAMPSRVFKEKSLAVDEGAQKRDKSLGPIEKTLFIFISIAEDQDAAYSTIEPVKHALVWPELLSQAGYDIEIDDEYKGLEYTKIMPNDTEMLKKFKEMGQKYYSREIVMDFIIAGSKQDVIKKMEDFIDVGVDHFFLRDFSPDKEKSFDILSKEILPYFRK